MPPTTIAFTVHGTPQPKGSARGYVAMKAGKARAIVTSDNRTLRAWEDSIRFAAQSRAGTIFFEDGPVTLDVTFYLQRPRSVTVRKRPCMTTRPDLSKLVRGLEDALTEILWKDDAQITSITATKVYADSREPSRAVIVITGHLQSAAAVTGGLLP